MRCTTNLILAISSQNRKTSFVVDVVYLESWQKY